MDSWPRPRPLDSGVWYWAFMVNPDYYRIEDVVRECPTDCFGTDNKEIRQGDWAIMWKAKGNHSEVRGIVALAKVTSDPHIATNPHHSYFVPPSGPEPLDHAVTRVDLRYVIGPSLPLWTDGTAHDLLLSLTVANSRGSVFHVTDEQWLRILDAAGVFRDGEFVDFDSGSPRTIYQLKAWCDRQVELHAMAAAIEYYRDQGWLADDVSTTEPYDLRCRRGRDVLHVEVKGTTTDGSTVALTANEVKHAREHYPSVALFVLANIQLTDSPSHPVEGGEPIILDPWNIADGDFVIPTPWKGEGTLRVTECLYTLPRRKAQGIP